AGIDIVATGGVGRAHRDCGNTFVIYPDLTEPARTPDAELCFGDQNRLELAPSLGNVQTPGVPGGGCCPHRIPPLPSPAHDLHLQPRVDSPEQAAELTCTHRDLSRLGPGATPGMLIANPPPAEKALKRDEVESLISIALTAAAAAGIHGKAVTPFLLEQLARNSGGKTLETNIALLVENARLAATIAVAYSARTNRRR